MNNILLYEEYRLVEKSESDISGVWKGTHLLLFFLAFVFGSFCTFCFHVLMYMFDEECVLFPKLMSLSAVKPSVVYEFIPVDEFQQVKQLPVDFLSAQWSEKSTCYMPTYVPLVSGIFGLVWTTMFLMCNSGSWTLTGLQRPWWVLPFVFLFSLTMSVMCVYSSCITHSGLNDLCSKLEEITGSPKCSYTVNVATLAYERHIKGVYQAIQLTLLTAWLHTACWLFSAVLATVRMLLVVDFQLVKVKVELRGNLDKILEHHEQQIRSITPEQGHRTRYLSTGTTTREEGSLNIYYENRAFLNESQTNLPFLTNRNMTTSFKEISRTMSEIHYINLIALDSYANVSTLSLLPTESYKNARRAATRSVPKPSRFIVRMLHDLIDSLPVSLKSSSHSTTSEDTQIQPINLELRRQYGQSKITETRSKVDNATQYTSRHTLYGSVVESSSSSLELKDDASEFELAKVNLSSKETIISTSSSARDKVHAQKEKVKKKVFIKTKAHVISSTRGQSSKTDTKKKKEKKD